MILYTDGVTDAMDANGDRLGEVKLRESLLCRRPARPPPATKSCTRFRRHVADRPQFDDITLVCLARNA